MDWIGRRRKGVFWKNRRSKVTEVGMRRIYVKDRKEFGVGLKVGYVERILDRKEG